MNASPEPGDILAVPRRRAVLLLAVALVVLALDAVTKLIAVAQLAGAEPVRLFGGGLYLVLVRNPGAAFGLGAGYTWVISLVMIVVVLGVLWVAPRVRSGGWGLGLGLVLGGALGNLTDRLLREPGPLRGRVVDFLSLLADDGSVWPVFNLADSAVVSGGVLLALLAVLGRDYDGSSSRSRAGDAGSAARPDAEADRP